MPIHMKLNSCDSKLTRRDVIRAARKTRKLKAERELTRAWLVARDEEPLIAPPQCFLSIPQWIYSYPHVERDLMAAQRLERFAS